MLRHCSTTTAIGPMLPCRQDVAMMQKQEERHRDKQSTLQRYEVHFTAIRRTGSATYFAVRKTTQHKLPLLKLGPTIYATGLPVVHIALFSNEYAMKTVGVHTAPAKPLVNSIQIGANRDFECHCH